MMGIMQELGLHVTNFDSVVNRFNDELSMKSYVLIDEGVTFQCSCISASSAVCYFFWCFDYLSVLALADVLWQQG